MNTYSPCKFSKLIGVSVRTLQRWDLDGTLIAYRNPKGRRYYTQKQYLDYAKEILEKTETNEVYIKFSSEQIISEQQVMLLKLICKEVGLKITAIINTASTPTA